MNKIKSVLSWAVYTGIAVLVTPWTLVVIIKLAFWPYLLTSCESEIVLNAKGEINKESALQTALELLVVGVLTLLLPTWMGLWLWITLVASHIFLLQLRLLTSSP